MKHHKNLSVLAQGAEAKIILQDEWIIKDRIPKSYRIPELDNKIRKRRTKAETKLLFKASKIINCPTPLESKELHKIKMPYIKGKRLSEHLNNFELKQQKQICKEIGKAVAKLHNNDIIHGDLTTSNMILQKDEAHLNPSEANKDSAHRNKKGGIDKGKLGSLYFIDFGLGFISHKYEDKAVDIHLLKQALEAKHFQNFEVLFKEIEKSYAKENKDSKIIFERLKAVEKRGRYKH